MERHCTRPLVAQQIQCGRGLAPDGGISAKNLLPDTLLSGASPLPHFDHLCVRFGWSLSPSRTRPTLCRSM
ncbi:hypothetical protein C4J89_0629 [Pseudomonas sp. R4-35-07]|nr:hypothetical protein C4J89_0629 [Pseudomonas sp. R4-35-07]